MGNLLFGARTDFFDCDIKIQVLAGERVVAIDRHRFVLHLNNANRDGALFGASLKLHTFLNILDPLKTVFWHDLLKRGIYLTISLFRLNTDFNSVADCPTLKSRLQTWNYIFVAVQVSERLVRLRLIEQAALIITQSVIHRHDCSF